jgi:ribosomal protein S18 acetylase RimI-like enzyme
MSESLENLPQAVDFQSENEKPRFDLSRDFFDLAEKEGLLENGSENEIDSEKFSPIADVLSSCSTEEYVNFLQSLSTDSRRHSLPQTVVKQIIERGFNLAEHWRGYHDDYMPDEVDDDELHETLIHEIERSIQLHGDYKREGPTDESLTDKSFKAILDLYPKHPQAAEKFFARMTQEYTVRRDIFVRGLADMMWRPEVSSYFKTEAIHGLNYLLSFDHGGYYNQAIVDNLDFDNPDNFFRTATFLEFIKKLYNVSQDFSFSEDTAGVTVGNVLKEAVDREKGSYLLNLRAQEIYNSVANRNQWIVDQDREPFLAEKNVYAFDFGQGLRLSQAKDFDKVSSLIKEYEEVEDQIQPPQYLIDQAIAAGESWVNFTPDPYLIEQRRYAMEKIISCFKKELSASDVAVSPEARRVPVNEEQEQALYDFKYLMSRPVREKIAEEFQVNFAELPLREKFYFLQFIKSQSAKDIAETKEFVRKFGNAGLRTFLSLEHDKNNGERIVKLGEKLEPEAAKEIFKKYGEIVGAAEKAGDYVKENFGGASPGEIDKVTENLLRRGKDLLAQFAEPVGKNKNLPGPEVYRQLEGIKTDILLFANTFKIVSAERPLEFSEIKGVELESKDSSELTMEDKAAMKKIFIDNRPGYPPELLAKVLADFEAALAGGGKKFYFLRQNQEIISFVRFDQIAADRLYLGSFNVQPEAKDQRIGGALLEATLAKEAKDKAVELVVYEKNPILNYYLKNGFQAVEEIADYHGTGQKFLRLERLAPKEKPLAA